MKPNELLKAKREALGYSQTKMAAEIGVKQGYISLLESGKTRITADVVIRYRQAVPITDDDALFLLGLMEV